MSFDSLSALRRLEARLREVLARRAAGPRWRLLLVVLAPILSLGTYAAASHWLLSGPTLRALINTKPESLRLDYDEATSLWPGRIRIRNLTIRGSDSNVQWIIRLASARVDYSVPALLQRTFRAKSVEGTGLSFHLRNKQDPAELAGLDVSVLPPVPGFADPPLRSPENQAVAPPGNPWRIDVRKISIGDFHDIWVDAFHFHGVARLQGGFFLRPGLLARIGPATVNLERGETRIGNAAARISVSGSVSGAFDPFEPVRVHGSEVWKSVSGDVRLDGRFERLESLAYLVRSAKGVGLEDGVGEGTIRGRIENGIARGEVRMKVQEGTLQARKAKWLGAADLRFAIPRWNLASGPLEFSGSRLVLSDVRSPALDSRRWWGRFDIPSGKRGATTSARIQARARDARPLLALFAAELPGWTRGLLDLDDFSATASVALGPSLTAVKDLDARGGNFHIRGSYRREKASREGIFLIESDALSVGLELNRSLTTVRLLGAKQWFEDGTARRRL